MSLVYVKPGSRKFIWRNQQIIKNEFHPANPLKKSEVGVKSYKVYTDEQMSSKLKKEKETKSITSQSSEKELSTQIQPQLNIHPPILSNAKTILFRPDGKPISHLPTVSSTSSKDVSTSPSTTLIQSRIYPPNDPIYKSTIVLNQTSDRFQQQWITALQQYIIELKSSAATKDAGEQLQKLLNENYFWGQNVAYGLQVVREVVTLNFIKFIGNYVNPNIKNPDKFEKQRQILRQQWKNDNSPYIKTNILTPRIPGLYSNTLPTTIGKSLYGPYPNGIVTIDELPDNIQANSDFGKFLTDPERKIYPLDPTYSEYPLYAVEVTGVPLSDGSTVDGRRCVFYVNGINTDLAEMLSTLDVLGWIFDQKVIGIYNPTKGILVDVANVGSEKIFRDKTASVNNLILPILDALLNPEMREVILVCHSQGTVATSVLFRALAKFSSVGNKIEKLRVFCFANASTEVRGFRNPNARIEPYIEHFGNALDPVARFGMLNPTYESNIDGPLYIRYGFNGHTLYDDYLKPLMEDAKYINENIQFFLTNDYEPLIPHLNFKQKIRKDGQWSDVFPDGLSFCWQYFLNYTLDGYTPMLKSNVNIVPS